jgi:hypothetical protein
MDQLDWGGKVMEGSASNDYGTPEMPEYLKRYHEELRLRQDMRGRRLLLCRSMDTFRACIEAMPIDAQERQELVNMANVLLRMVVIKNDGGPVSHCKVNAF